MKTFKDSDKVTELKENERYTAILLEMSDYVKATHDIDVDTGFETVDMVNLETGETEWFLQGHEAAMFIAEADLYFEDTDTNISWSDATHLNAKKYIDSI